MRKIKLMALLLAALMIVTAFAGCAGVKQEVVDDLDDRVSKIEDLLLQQNDTIGDLADKIENGGSNDDVLAAIESMNKDLSDKIDDLENRVQDVENKPVAGGTDANVQAKQTEALASIAVQKAEFNKNAAEYDDEAFAAITSAFAKAEATVTAATTEAEVAAAMATLETTLDSYKTYAMKLYDYYIALLGNINDDAEQLVEEALDFIDVIDEVYEDLDYTEDEKEDALRYVVAEATATTRAKTLDVYNSVKGLCAIYEDEANTAFQYVDAKGNVKTYTEALTLAGYKDQAKKIVKDIKNIIGEDGLTYATLLKVDVKAKNYKGTVQSFEIVTTGDDANGDKQLLALLQDTYEAFVKSAEFVGGQALVDLVTNADLLVDTADAAEKFYDARDAYAELNGRVKGNDLDGFYYFTEIAAADNDNLVIVDPEDKEEYIFLDEYYTEKVDEVIADWIEEFDLTAEDAAAIINEAEKNDEFYDEYLKTRREVALVSAAYEKFLKEIVPGIKTLNKLSSKSAEAVEDFNELLKAVEALHVLQEKDVKSEDVADRIDIPLEMDAFKQFVEQSGVVAVDDITLYRVEAKEEAAKDDKTIDVDEYVKGINVDRVDAVMAKITDLSDIKAEQFVELFTFAADIKDLDKEATGESNDYIALYATKGEKYNFFAKEFGAAQAFADKINAAIAYLVYEVENNKISNNEGFIKLAGEYVLLRQATAEDFAIVYNNGTADEADDITYTKAGAAWVDENGDPQTDTTVKDTLYVASADAINYAEDYKKVEDGGTLDVLAKTFGEADGVSVMLKYIGTDGKPASAEQPVFTIEFFNYAFPTFTSLINVEAFEDAKEAAETRIKALFDDVDELKAILEEVAYVRGTAYEYKDLNGNGKNDGGKEMPYDENSDYVITSDSEKTEWAKYEIDENTVSLNDKAKFDEAVKIYDAWVFAGGKESLKLFAEKLDDEGESYGGLYVMEGFDSTDGVGAVLETLRKLNDKFTTLVTLANNFTGAVKLVGDVDSYNSITATKLDGAISNNIDRWAITAFKNSDNTSDHSNINGDWKYVVLSSNGNLTTDTYKDINSTSTAGVAANFNSNISSAYTKEELLKAVVAYYVAFEAANIEYVAASNNDYDDDETFNFYANKGYDAYKAVDDAKATYEKYDLIAAKGACLIAATGTDDATTTFKGHVTSATTLAALDNAIANYISVGGTAPALAGWTIYDFDSID